MLDFLREYPVSIVVIGIAAYVVGSILGGHDPDAPRKWYDLRGVETRKNRK